jgi:DNA-binding response OmpR family regulator
MSGASTEPPSRRHILVAEDEFLVATVLEEDLRAAGYGIVGPFASLAKAVEAARSERFDLAILDVNLNGEMVYPLADELLSRGVPFLFLSGYGKAHLPERFRALPQLAKPYDPRDLLRRVAGCLGGA